MRVYALPSTDMTQKLALLEISTCMLMLCRHEDFTRYYYEKSFL